LRTFVKSKGCCSTQTCHNTSQLSCPSSCLYSQNFNPEIHTKKFSIKHVDHTIIHLMRKNIIHLMKCHSSSKYTQRLYQHTCQNNKHGPDSLMFFGENKQNKAHYLTIIFQCIFCGYKTLIGRIKKLLKRLNVFSN
jgi:hypothetical protein